MVSFATGVVLGWRVGYVKSAGRRLGRVLLAITACTVAVVPGLAPGASAASAGWKVVYYVPNGTYAMNLVTITAPSVTDAWATGWSDSLQELHTSYYSPLYHWNGKAWSPVATGGPLHQYKIGGVSATSPRNVLAAGYGVTLHYNGTHWTVYKTAPPAATADMPAVLAVGPGAWVPGTGDNYWWTGKAWKAYPVYGQITQLWGTNPDSIWGAGLAPDKITAEIVHWNGTNWKVTKFFRNAPAGTWSTQVSVAADSATSWWLLGSSSLKNNPFKITTFACHWNGRYWAPVPVPAALTGLNSAATTDGAGGFWAVQGTPEPAGGGLYNARLIHYSNGHWAFGTLPAITGSRSGGGVAPPFPEVLRHIPGTTSMWAIVDYTSDPSAAFRTVVMKYTP